jgi:rhodanese-related sulfurtransferase/uncharacterized protein YciI
MKIFQPHLDFLTALRARGIVLGNGRLIDGPGGLILLRATDEAEAREILSRDPFLVHGIRTLELYEWDTRWAAGTSFPPYDPAIAEIAAGWLDARLGANPDAFVLDVREDEEVARGTAPRTIHIPLGQLEARLAELPAGEIFAICRGGGRSLKASRLLAAHGRAAINVAGGMTAYAPEKA